MKILTISDLHGCDDWKHKDFSLYDRVIFLGDYVDSFQRTDEEIITNLSDIIELKKSDSAKFILLIGNHDNQYWFLNIRDRCSGWRDSYAVALNTIFMDNKDIFKLMHQEQNYLWSHAGIHTGWFKFHLMHYLDERVRFELEGLKTPYIENLDDIMNEEFLRQNTAIFMVGKRRGGWDNMGGPLWLDKDEAEKPLVGYHQIVGHTGVKEIKKLVRDGNTSITFMDLQRWTGRPGYLETIIE